MSKQTPQIVQSFLSNKWFCVTKYRWTNKEKGQFESLEKFDITEQIESILEKEIQSTRNRVV